MSFMHNSINNNRNNSSFGHNSNSSTISHNSIHESKHSTNFHKDIHDHNKIHESMHLGNDKIRSPFNHNMAQAPVAPEVGRFQTPPAPPCCARRVKAACQAIRMLPARSPAVPPVV